MPEGDTVLRTARTLRAVLAGREVLAASSTVARIRALGVDRLVGQTIAKVQPRGKHLLVWFAPSDLALHSHMRMTGSWHTYAPGEAWRKPAHLARMRLEVPGCVAVLFAAPVCELLTRRQVDNHPALRALGPDALAPGVDLAEARRRLDALGERAVGEALGDQRVLAGVGNVYRCEILFIHAVDPWSPVADLPADTRDGLLSTAQRLLEQNAAPGAGPRRTTSGGPRHHVYGRGRRPCPRCSTPIRVARQGAHARVTYWCPRCQGPGAS